MIKLTYILLLFSVMGFAQNPAHIQVQLGVADNSPKPPQDKGTPLLTNFRIEDANKDRVYFDASNDVTGLTTTGFVISGKTISSVTIDGDGLGGYFTVSSDFTFWDNNTIRLGENDDASHRQTTLYNFSLQYIENNINEPIAPTVRYVTTFASGSGDGTSEGNAWTLSQAFSNATSGMTVWIKAGNYGNIQVAVSNNGTSTNPIKFKGYKTTVGDLDDVVYYSYGDGNPSGTDAPLLLGNGSGYGISLINKDYIFLENLQIDNYQYCISGYNGSWGGTENAVFRNIITNRSTVQYYFSVYNNNSNHRYKKCISVDANDAAFYLASSYSLIEDCETHINNDYGNFALDYHIELRGVNSIVRNHLGERHSNTSHSGHGISLKSDPTYPSEYNLVVDCEMNGVNSPVQFRHDESRYNVCRGLVANGNGRSAAGGVQFRDGANNNIVENIDVRNTTSRGAVIYIETTEEGFGQSTDDNIVRNSIFDDALAAIWYGTIGTGSNNYDGNKIYNCTFNNMDELITNGLGATITNQSVINNIFNASSNGDSYTGISFNKNNFTGGVSTQGTNATTHNPNFVDTTDFVPQNDNLITAPTLFGVEYDYNGDERDDTTTTIGSVKDNDE